MPEAAPPTFSVISPSLNQGRYIADCLASVALQGAHTYEHLVLDGGSSDETAEVVSRFPHARFISLPASGQSEALNEGFERARGQVICWLNTDDVLLPGAFDVALDRLNAMGTRGYVTSHFLLVDEHQALLELRRVPAFSPFLYRNVAVYLPTSGSFVTNNLGDHGVALKADLHMIMDRDFHLQLHAAGYEFAIVDSYLSAFRVHDSNKSEVQDSRGKTADRHKSASAAQRREEGLRLNAEWGGVFLGSRRLLGSSGALTLLAKVLFVIGLRFRTWRTARRAVDIKRQTQLLGDWRERQQGMLAQVAPAEPSP